MALHTPGSTSHTREPARQTRPNAIPEGPSVLETSGFEAPEVQMKLNPPPVTPGFSSIEKAIL